MEQPITLVQNGPLTIEIHEGQKGDPGKSLRFEDLTPEQIEQLKGPKGDKGDPGSGADVKDVYDMLVSRGYLPNSSSLTDVLNLIIDKANITDLFRFAELVVRVPVKYGDTIVQVGGMPIDGLVIKEQGTDNTYTITNNQFSYPFTLSHPMDERTVTLEAIWQGQIKSTLVIPGIQANTPVEIASDPAYENIEGPHEIDYREVDNQLWLRQAKSPTSFKNTDVSKLVEEHNISDCKTLVLDLSADGTFKLSNFSTSLSIRYDTMNGDNHTIVDNDYLMFELEYWHVGCDNLIIVLPNQPLDTQSTKSKIAFMAPKNMLVGIATKGTTSVPCITANAKDVVQFDVANNTVEILGTNGQTEYL